MELDIISKKDKRHYWKDADRKEKIKLKMEELKDYA
jgi:hypothetical protein